VPIIFLVLIALGLTAAASLRGFIWLLPAVVSYIVLWVYIGYAVSKVTYVKYQD
jgi:hypothetical protein